MSLHHNLLEQANHLASKEPRRPKQASLRRSISTSYYALFHLLTNAGSRRLVNQQDRENLRHCLARAFSHGKMKQVARDFSTNNVNSKIQPGLNNNNLQPELIRLAQTFVDLQQARHDADYNTAQMFMRQEAIDAYERAKQAFSDWETIKSTVQADTFLVALLAQDRMQA